jgi:hypothetical protein
MHSQWRRISHQPQTEQRAKCEFKNRPHHEDIKAILQLTAYRLGTFAALSARQLPRPELQQAGALDNVTKNKFFPRKNRLAN